MEIDQIRLASLSDKYLNLIIMPTEACNFRCTYCYETFELKKMRPEVTGGIKALIDRRSAELGALSIDWFGGEPLMAMDVITDISSHAIRVAKERSFGFSAKITTNGYYLDGRRFSACLQSGINHFQISFDGDKAVHDASRKLVSGAGTFDRLWENVERIKGIEGDFSVLLRLHFTYENYRSVAEFGRKLNDMLGDDRRFQYIFKGIGRWGGTNDHQITLVPRQERAAIDAYLWERSGLPHTESLQAHPVCYAGMANSFVIRSNGHLAKCTVALTDGFNDIGRISESGEVSVDQDKFRRWIAPLVEQRWEDAGCPLASVARAAFAVPAPDMVAPPSERVDAMAALRD